MAGADTWVYYCQMFRKKDQYYEPEGLKYIDWQKKIMHIMFVLFAALIILIEWSAP